MVSYEMVLQGIVILCYFSLILYATYYLYTLLTSEAERKRYRTRIQRELMKKKEKMILKAEETALATKLRRAGTPLFVTAYRYQIMRWTLLLTLLIYYIVLPLFSTYEINLVVLGLLIVIFIFTSPILRFSVINYILDQLIILRHKKKHQELFTLFDMLQAELTSLGEQQEINVYSLIRDCVQYFDYIDTALIKFLHIWKHDPILAKDTLAEEIGGEDAETLSNILYKIDETSKEHAVEILHGASQIFSVAYFEGGNRKKEKRFVLIDAFFFSVNMLTIAWLLMMVVSMFTNLLHSTHL